MYEKAWCTCKVVVLLIKPMVYLTFSLPFASLDLGAKAPGPAKRGGEGRLFKGRGDKPVWDLTSAQGEH